MCIRVVNVKGFASDEKRGGVAYVGPACFGWLRHPLCNPAALSAYYSRDQCLAAYREHIAKMPDLEKRLAELWEECQHGARPLGCWCVDDPGPGTSAPVCHAQILAELLRERFVDPDCKHDEHRGDGKGNWVCANCELFLAKLNIPDTPRCETPAGKNGGL